jgi:ubiquinone/menaquinone biosynthesis C-methylase UbiE
MRSNAEWIEWGRRAITIRKGYRELSDEQYYAAGVDWRDYAEAWTRTTGYRPGTIVEIGCNCGRLTKALASEFRKVVAVDVSPHVIEYGRSRIPAENIFWHAGDGNSLPVADGSADCVFSCLVFQHFPDNAAQLRMFGEIWRALKPGGTFFIHIPVHSFPAGRFSAIARSLYRAFCVAREMKTFIAVQRMRFGGRTPMRGVSYEMTPLLTDLSNLGFANVGMTTVRIRRLNEVYICIFGVKPQRFDG